MANYFYKGAYTPAAWSGLLSEPREIEEAMKPSAEKYGGKVINCFLFMGTSGAEPGGFMEFPDNTAATAWSISLLAGGILSRVDIIPLLTGKEGVDALRRIGSQKP
jgi:uncharacterized protein with GYD domain